MQWSAAISRGIDGPNKKTYSSYGVRNIPNQSHPKKGPCLEVAQSLDKLIAAEFGIVNAGVVLTNHLDRGIFFLVVQEPCRPLVVWQHEPQHNRPQHRDGSSD